MSESGYTLPGVVDIVNIRSEDSQQTSTDRHQPDIVLNSDFAEPQTSGGRTKPNTSNIGELFYFSIIHLFKFFFNNTVIF